MNPHANRITSILFALSVASATSWADEHLPNTELLKGDGDIAAELVEGVDRFLLNKLATSATRRARRWDRDPQSHEAYDRSVAPNRKRLAHILGLRDQRHATIRVYPVQTLTSPAAVAGNSEIQRIRWDAFDDIQGEGLMISPPAAVRANVVVIPDVSQTPESLLVGNSYVRQLAASGCRVVIPALVSRRVQQRRNAELTDREFLYRSAFELGRHVIGYELQKVLAAIDWFAQQDGDEVPTAVIGWGEGGMLALYAAALDTRIDTSVVSGYFGQRWNQTWNGPIDRNVFGLVEEFGDAELASLVAPRTLILDRAAGPTEENRTRSGAPYVLTSPSTEQFDAELKRTTGMVVAVGDKPWAAMVAGRRDEPIAKGVLDGLADSIGTPLADVPQPLQALPSDPTRPNRIIDELDQFTQRVLAESPYTRKQWLSALDVTSVESHAHMVEAYREFFRHEVIGHFDDPLLPMNPRTRKVYDTPKWTGYEVVLDVFPDVIAFGILLLPRDLQPDEKRPVVVCQHGLEGRPRDIIEGDRNAYHDFSAKLADRGFITFAPQNLYIFRDKFRTLQRKANPLGKTLFSVIVPQHQQIVDWLAQLPGVDPDRIAFYGLSYGGKSAMRIPPLVDRYCMSICSADFNDWVWKNASTLSPYSYVWTGEYEIFEWDLGSTFNYAEMAALIAPRPFMVERGHFDGVAPDERVALEFAKVRHLYQAKLGIGDRCEIEFFVGPHTINGKGTFDFLHRHLSWPNAHGD